MKYLSIMGQSYTIDQDRLYKLFKRVLNDKFSELTLNENPWWETHEDDVEWVNSNGNPVIRYTDNHFLVHRKYYWSFMNMMPISYKTTNDLFTKYFKERFPDKFFISVLDSDLYVNNINESLSSRIRRRLSFDSLKSELDFSVIDEMYPCQFSTPGEFIAEACDMLKDISIDTFYDVNISAKDKDQLYYYLVDTFGDYLYQIYLKHCTKKR